MTSHWKLGLGFTLVTVLMWGLLPLALNGVLHKMDPVTVSWYRFSLSALIALLWYGWRSGPALKSMLARSPGYSFLAIAGLLGNYLCYIWGLERTNPGAAQVLIQVAPLILLIASVFLFKESFAPRQWLGVAGFTAGMMLFFYPRWQGQASAEDGYLLGVMLVLAGAVTWSFYGIAQKQLLVNFHAKDILLLICVCGTVALAPMAEPGQVTSLDGRELTILLFCGLNTIVAYGCFGLAMSHWEASRVSAIVPCAPLVTLLVTYAMNSAGLADIPAEPVSWMIWLGAAMVVGGGALAAISPRVNGAVGQKSGEL
ncbi:MAG: DMT family transporter [Halioglobus sp.]